MKPLHPKLLVIEDDDAVREFLVALFEDEGYDVRCARQGAEGLVSMCANRPDAIILDVRMPVMDGWAFRRRQQDLDGFGVCEILRRDPLTATIPIIIVSAWSSPDSRNLGLELGALDYITKPFSPQELVERVNRLIHVRAG